MARGEFRIYLGAAPGVGKTYAALAEAARRRERGADVVVGFVETHGRGETARMVGDLPVLPRKPVSYRGGDFEEFDLEGALRRRPEVLLVDELAHSNVPGSAHEKRWQDIDVLLDEGIDVVSTVNIQHLDSLNDVVAAITGVQQRETVPDEVVRRADQIELADITPEALRKRMQHGNVYPPEKIDAALSNYFRVGNLTALREIALLWLADKVESQLERYRSEKEITATWESKERVVVALSGGSEGETLIRRAARIAARNGADLKAVYVAAGDGLSTAKVARDLARQRGLVENYGGSFHQVVGESTPEALLDFARGVNATQLVLGASRRGHFAQLFSRGIGNAVTAMSGSIDVHLVTHENVRRVKAPSRRGVPGQRRRLAGLGLALVGIPLLIMALVPLRETIPLTNVMLIVLSAVMAVTLAGGMWPALLGALTGFAWLNFFFTDPLNTFFMTSRDQVLTLVVFVLLALGGATVVNISARRARAAARAGAEAQTLAALATNVLRSDGRLPAVLSLLQETFGLDSVSLLERRGPSSGPRERHEERTWQVVGSAGPACATPGEADNDILIDGDLTLAVRGRTLHAAERRMVQAFAIHAAAALKESRLAEQAERSRALADTDRMRTALLAAVSHDLRTPLASARMAVNSLQDGSAGFSEEDRAELLDAADLSLTRLTALVDNLLDMSRLQAGTLGVIPVAVGWEDIVAHALRDFDSPLGDIRVPADLPEVLADVGLASRIVANLVGNALRHSPDGRPPQITASSLGDAVQLRVIDHGPGVDPADHDTMFTPFQRLGDRDNASGVGLGLALARGLAEAMDGSVAPEVTPGGGLTMVVELPAAREERDSDG